jgi:hypothetical protein
MRGCAFAEIRHPAMAFTLAISTATKRSRPREVIGLAYMSAIDADVSYSKTHLRWSVVTSTIRCSSWRGDAEELAASKGGAKLDDDVA